jgi:hypothetical protein
MVGFKNNYLFVFGVGDFLQFLPKLIDLKVFFCFLHAKKLCVQFLLMLSESTFEPDPGHELVEVRV